MDNGMRVCPQRLNKWPSSDFLVDYPDQYMFDVCRRAQWLKRNNKDADNNPDVSSVNNNSSAQKFITNLYSKITFFSN